MKDHEPTVGVATSSITLPEVRGVAISTLGLPPDTCTSLTFIRRPAAGRRVDDRLRRESNSQFKAAWVPGHSYAPWDVSAAVVAETAGTRSGALYTLLLLISFSFVAV